MEFYLIRNLAERLARKQRIATLAVGVKTAEPTWIPADVIEEAVRLDHEIERTDNAHFGHSD
jgi:hypothetical protein